MNNIILLTNLPIMKKGKIESIDFEAITDEE